MELVQNFSQIEKNALNFQKIRALRDSVAFNNLNRYYHWYYFPEKGIFAPSKFIGYVGTTAKTYQSLGTGTDTTRVLNKFFNKIDRDSQSFSDIFDELNFWLHSLGSRVSQKTINGTGGIYIPKEYQLDEPTIGGSSTESFLEGHQINVTQSRSERNIKARMACIKKYGLSCLGCKINFEKFYGEIGKDFIHVHHLTPLSTIKTAYKVDPEKDLVPLCPNCHAMIHRLGDFATVEMLRNSINQSK